MTFDELQTIAAPLAAELDRLADVAEADDFAPWVVQALRSASWYAGLDDNALNAARQIVEGRKLLERDA